MNRVASLQQLFEEQAQAPVMKGKADMDFGLFDFDFDVFDPLMAGPMMMAAPAYNGALAFESDDAVIPSFNPITDDLAEVPLTFGNEDQFVLPLEDEVAALPAYRPAAPVAAVQSTEHAVPFTQGNNGYSYAYLNPYYNNGQVQPATHRPATDLALHRPLDARVAKPKTRRPDAPRPRHSRKAFADGRPRIKGRFARKEEVEAYMAEHVQDDAPEVSTASVNDHVVPQF